jgi:hypothetical protein
MPLKHPFVSGKSDGGDATLVKPSNWNDVHIGTIDVLDVTVFSATGDQQLTTADCAVGISTSGGAGNATVYLPQMSVAYVAGGSRSGVGQKIQIFRKDSSTGIVYIQPYPTDPSSVQIVFQPNYQLVNQGQFVVLIPDGSQWWVIGGN